MPIFYKNLLWHYQFSHCIEIRSDIVSYSCTYRETKSRQTRGRKIDRMGISRCTRRNDREESGRPPSLASHPFASKDNRRNKAEGDITFTTPVWIDGASMITRYFPSSCHTFFATGKTFSKEMVKMVRYAGLRHRINFIGMVLDTFQIFFLYFDRANIMIKDQIMVVLILLQVLVLNFFEEISNTRVYCFCRISNNIPRALSIREIYDKFKLTRG